MRSDRSRVPLARLAAMAKSLRDVGDPPLMKEGWEDVLDGVFEKMCGE